MDDPEDMEAPQQQMQMPRGPMQQRPMPQRDDEFVDDRDDVAPAPRGRPGPAQHEQYYDDREEQYDGRQVQYREPQYREPQDEVRRAPAGRTRIELEPGDVMVQFPRQSGHVSGDRSPRVPPDDRDRFPQGEPRYCPDPDPTPAPRPAPRPKPTPKPHPRPLPPSSAERIRRIHRAEHGVEQAADQVEHDRANFTLLLELAGKNIKRGLWSKAGDLGKGVLTMDEVLRDELEKVESLAIDRAAKMGAVAALQGFAGSESYRGPVYHAADVATDYIADINCEVKSEGIFLRKSLEALEALGRRRPPCPCGCGKAAHAQPQSAPADSAAAPRKRTRAA